ncbi:MAG: CopG family transcriptional regulator [Cellulomonadaceae bacterium]|nr:CopG family transcriptional regulator [Cellulomonadaceae bacterium]
MKTAISVPDAKAERFERVAAKHSMNRSEFYVRAGDHFADSLEDNRRLTRLANAAIEASGQPSVDSADFRRAARTIIEGNEW